MIQNSKALVIRPVLKHSGDRKQDVYRLQESIRLANAINIEVVESELIYLSKFISGTLLGSGKLSELASLIAAKDISLVVIDEKLSPIQQRNLEKKLNTKVIDRTLLIIEIFSSRANTSEGRLQSDLAALEYQKSRLVRSWTHLERQRGGFGFIGGPGEKQIESDRRQISDQIVKIKKELETVKNTRTLHRKQREKVPYQIVSLVGYTNAGKSSLFNLLTGEKVMAKDMLFATLDPTMRQVKLRSNRKIILSDTVGFITDLPTELVMAFRATLEEVKAADLILHIVDISQANYNEQIKAVDTVLGKLNLGEGYENRMILVFNKLDLIEDAELKESFKSQESKHKIYISVVENINIDNLQNMIDEFFSSSEHRIRVSINNDGKLLAWMYENAEVVGTQELGEETILEVKISAANQAKLWRIINENQGIQIIQG